MPVLRRVACAVALACLATEVPLYAQVKEPNGLPVPQPVGTYETGMVSSRKKDMTSFFQASDVTLAGLFAARGEQLDPIQDAKIAPATFSPQCGFTGTLVMRGGACRVDFGWYNVNASGQVPSDSEIYTLIPKEDDSVFTCSVKESQYVTRTYQDFCPLAYHNSPEAQALSPLKSFGADSIRADPRYQGGQIGFALRGSGSPCSQTKFSEARLNTVCTTCSPQAPWVTTLIYQSSAVPDGYYIAFEDLPLSPTEFKTDQTDGDFNDFVYFVSGLSCTGAGLPCDTGLQGACAVGRTDCSEDGTAPACRSAVEPGAEKCDNVDNDCNGQVDDGEGLCQAGQVCVHGACVEACGTGEFRCSPGFQCRSGFCIEDACDGVSCAAGEVCLKGQCVDACAGAICPTNQRCQLGRCVDPCAGTSCPAGRVCEEGLCLADCGCRSCGEGKSCGGDGRCVDASCAGKACAVGEICVAGGCVDPCAGARCPGGASCQNGQCGDPTLGTGGGGSDAGIMLGSGGDLILNLAGSANASQADVPVARRVFADPGCACSLQRRSASGGWLVLLLAGALLRWRRLRSLTLLVACACSAAGGSKQRLRGGAGGPGTDGPDLGGVPETEGPTLGCPPGSDCAPDAPAPPGCGDTVLTEDEACDDGNRAPGDGCAANCLSVEAGYSCSAPGQACHPIARCGDGVVAPSEGCDDGARVDGDGCSARCKLELGFKCQGAPSVCSPATCGDGLREGAEGCDDGNRAPFDGCSADCQAEPDCSEGACVSQCGDGLVLGAEECDDGNATSGDGCDAACRVEPGVTCLQHPNCEQINGQCVLRVPAIFRDFQATHVDFGHGCPALTNGIETGIAKTTLGPDRKPQLSAGAKCVHSAESFREWYRPSPNNAAIVGSLVLWSNGVGGFVNRYGENGEQWQNKGDYLITNYYCGAGPGDCTSNCTVGAGQKCFYPCPGSSSGQDVQCLGTQMGAGSYDGNPLFFPIDDSPLQLSDTRYDAMIPGGTTYGYQSWVSEKSVVPGAHQHNFHFTTEVHYWFKFDASQTALFDFTGDDDVFVFVNGQLAVDLGGVHAPINGSVSLNAASAAQFDLESGSVYEIAVFHAERNVAGSSFKLTLAGFDTSRSDCSPNCGDAIVSVGEECDDGVNDGGYGECAPGCVLGAYCGDGVIQAGEQCDDGNRFDGDGCGSGCRNVVVK